MAAILNHDVRSSYTVVRLSPVHTVAEMCDCRRKRRDNGEIRRLSHFSATVALFATNCRLLYVNWNIRLHQSMSIYLKNNPAVDNYVAIQNVTSALEVSLT